MVKTRGPVVSLEAGKAIGGAVVFQTWKGRTYMKKLTTPTNPKSDLQVGTRAMHQFLTSQWTLLGPTLQATWETLAAQTEITPFDAFMSFNLKRFARFLAPSIEYPLPAPRAAGLAILNQPTQQGRGALTESYKLTGSTQWGWVMSWSLGSSHTAARDNVVKVFPDLGTHHIWQHSLLPRGQQCWRVMPFSTAGDWGSTFAAKVLTLT